MKSHHKPVIVFLLGAIFLLGLAVAFKLFLNHDNNNHRSTETASGLSMHRLSHVINNKSLNHCEIFFAEELGEFEAQINQRLTNARLVQSNILLSKTTQNIGYYALICY